MHTKRLFVAAALLAPACGGSKSSSEPVTVDFRAENDLLGSFEQDSGFVPEGAPAAIRVVASANAGLVAAAQAIATGDELTPVEGSGSLEMEAGFSLEISARLDASGIEWEGVVETFEYGIDPASTTFEPFAIGEAVTLSSPLPPGELARVPIPSVPGATLVVDIASGELNTTYSGVCAAAMGGVAQYTAEAVIDGTLGLEGTIEIEIPIVGTETFGPFAVDIPIPATTSALDLGTLSTSDGMPADGSPCDGVSGDTDDPTAASTDGDPTGDDPTDDPTGDDPTGDDPTGDDPTGDESTGGPTSDTDDTTDPGTSTGGFEPEDNEDACSDAVDNDGDELVDCEDPDCEFTLVCAPKVPMDWTCPPEFYGVDDGCDCGCGVIDPDCMAPTSDACEFCNAKGACSLSCDDINPMNNAVCL